ncbi:hypothetical protein ALC57_16982 [Trachymyrmex cornetzi]|uniref:Uncharacterized protein n=1 Tax=Trachymyrmex cornetzi TaxID=471704 RepID=A0A151IU14_9HYME|nr:hypothetical protein ALC57_16982 [Trachymyrmex cornetzi]
MTSKLKTNNKDIAVDPTLVFQRISLVKKDEEELKGFFQYELAPYPLSIFNENGMRKNTKSDFYDLFISLTENPVFKNTFYVIDGGFLLHKVVWPKNSTYFEIFTCYVNYIKRNYVENLNCIVVFDGYSNSFGTKNSERLRRLHDAFSTEIKITDIHTCPPTNQKTFLLNSNNKTQFISLLCCHFEEMGIEYKECDEDADVHV